MSHKYHCESCDLIFYPDDSYDDNPQTRVCIKCGHNPVLYEGYIGFLPNIQRDHIGEGLKGIVNPVNGKKYDSKSAYEKDIKASGHVIMGNDAPTKANNEIRGDFNVRKELKDAVQQVFSNQKRGKK